MYYIYIYIYTYIYIYITTQIAPALGHYALRDRRRVPKVENDVLTEKHDAAVVVPDSTSPGFV